MNRLLQFVSRALEPLDQEIVLGDLAESGASGVQALFDVLGLVVRRQLAVWKSWQPWFALIGVAGISGFYSSQMLVGVQIVVVQQLWAMQRYGVNLERAAYMFALAIAMFCWSMINGFLLRRYSGRVRWATGALFYFVVIDSATVRQYYSRGSLSWPGFGWSTAEIALLVAVRVLLFDIPAMLGVIGKMPQLRWRAGKHRGI